MTLFDYTYEGITSPDGISIPQTMCKHKNDYMFLREPYATESKSVHVCAGQYRKQNVYLTTRSHVEVTLASTAQRNTAGHFLLEYEGR